MIYLAFYRGEGRFLSDTLVQRVTRSEFSHCELFVSELPPLPGQTHLCVSAVGKHGGVCVREMTFRPGAYEFVPVPWAPSDTFERAERHLGKGYDYWGLLMTQLVNMRRHTADRWFCSKLCAKAMGLADPHTYAPGDLKRVVEEHNRTYFAAQELAETRASAIRPRATHGTPFFPGSGIFASGLRGGLRGASESAANALSHLTGHVDAGGVRAVAPQRLAKRTQGLTATRTRPGLAQAGTVIRFPGRVAR